MIKKIITLIAVIFMASCGASKSISNSATNDSSNEPDPTNSQQSIVEVGNPTSTISGTVTKGRLINAEVVIHLLNNDATLGDIQAITKTDVNGEFKITGNFLTPLAIAVTGGTYTDEATGILVVNNFSDPLLVYVPQNGSITGLSITPLTTIAALRTRFLAQSLQTSDLATNINQAKIETANLFNLQGIDITYSYVTDLLKAKQIDIDKDQDRYALTIAALSQILADNGLPAETLMSLIFDFGHDFADGEISDSFFLDNFDQSLENFLNSSALANWHTQILLPTQRIIGDGFGKSVAISQNTMVIGAPHDNTLGINAGAVYIITCEILSGLCPTSAMQKIFASNTTAGDRFGAAVAIEDETIIIGAPSKDGASVDSGAVYIFEKNADGSWSDHESAELISSDSEPGQSFGYALALKNGIALIGAPHFYDGENAPGQAYLFVKNEAGEWPATEDLTFEIPEETNKNLFGAAVTLSNNLAVIGAPLAGNIANRCGYAYIFTRDGFNRWLSEASYKLEATDSNHGDYFGQALALHNDTIIVGAPQDDEIASNAGAAYIYKMNPDETWPAFENNKLIFIDSEENDHFGYAVSLSAQTGFITAPNHQSDTMSSGIVHTITKSPAENWTITDANFSPLDNIWGLKFGIAIASNEEILLVGAPIYEASDFLSLGYLFNLP
ncbi:MAG: hypothetical protein ABH859_06205 [Pseudomonadota bacterium]